MKLKRYLPLIVLIAIAGLGALALVSSAMDLMHWMRFFMGLLLCQFSMLKLFNLPRFADEFQMYDWIAKRSRAYAYFYPFLELCLGLAYLSGNWLMAANLLTIVVMSIGSVGVIQALKAGLDVRCACMGTILDVPLSTVTLTEDIGMGLMALISKLVLLF